MKLAGGRVYRANVAEMTTAYAKGNSYQCENKVLRLGFGEMGWMKPGYMEGRGSEDD